MPWLVLGPLDLVGSLNIVVVCKPDIWEAYLVTVKPRIELEREA